MDLSQVGYCKRERDEIARLVKTVTSLPLKRKDWDTYFLDLADMVATRSTCPRAHHGAVLVDRYHRILSTGYNGSAPGEDHCEDVGCIIEDGHCIRTKDRHAEDNCLDGWCGEREDTLYLTANPCPLCRVMIIESGVEHIVYRNHYFNGIITPLGRVQHDFF